MAIREILRMGNPILLKEAEKVEKFDTPEIRELIMDMIDTMKDLCDDQYKYISVGEQKMNLDQKDPLVASFY